MPGRKVQFWPLHFAEDLGGVPGGHEGGFIDEEGGAGPIPFRMAHQFEPADAALHHFHVLALLAQAAPHFGHRTQPAIVSSKEGRA